MKRSEFTIPWLRKRVFRPWALVFLWLLAQPVIAPAQLFTNLQAFATRIQVGDPEVKAEDSLDGPKGIAMADFDRDGNPDLAVANTDGTVTLVYGRGQGKFGAPVHLQTGVQELRGIVAADLTGDGLPDIAAAAPYDGVVFLFVNHGGTFGSPVQLPAWSGARNLAAGDFDGDGQPDLAVAGTTTGLAQWRGRGGGNFEVVAQLDSLSFTNSDLPKPLFAMVPFRGAGASHDQLAVTHADSDRVWILTPDNAGLLRVGGVVTNQHVHALAVGALLHPASSNVLDLVTASRERETVEVHAGGTAPGDFEQKPTQVLQVPGGPRALAIADLDRDGWNDLVVVLRNFDRVLAYHNSNGVLVATSEIAVGRSPRELVTADFNGDGYPDMAVMNRDSTDVSILLTYPGQSGFSTLDQTYPVDGEVSGLLLFDFNQDGRQDVIQLHRASGEFSVRLSGPGGVLGAPKFYPMGSLPSANAIVDINGDGFADLVTANLGKPGLEGGSVSVRLGDGKGGFGEEERYVLPESVRGGLFSIVAADFDNDGDIDIAAGFYDCRLAFFENVGDGVLRFTQEHRFVYESRVMVTGDFDKDGDIDIAGAGYAGDVVVIENTGNLMHQAQLVRYDYPATSGRKFGTRDIVATDVNGDGDLDLIVGSGDGTMLFLGGEGMAFFPPANNMAGTDFPSAGVAVADLDGDGIRDVAVSCRILSCLTILTGTAKGEYVPALTVQVPSGDYLAAGDVDGDGLPDLVGTGSVLWTALSSRRAKPVPPSPPLLDRETPPVPVINELLAINTSVPLDTDSDRTSEWVELYNAGGSGLPLRGWHLRLVKAPRTASATTNDFAFPTTAFFPPKGHLVLVCSETRRTPYHTGFRLPAEGGILSLVDGSGKVVDSVEYAAQEENIAYGRYHDGSGSFAFNPFPSPGRPNVDNGPVEPVAHITSIEPLPMRPDEPIRFKVQARDDVGVIGVSILWQRLDIPDPNVYRVVLYDDGLHGDEVLLDGIFTGLMPEGLPPGAAIQFYLEVTDLSNQTVTYPGEPVFTARSRPINLYSMSVGDPRPSIEISEVVASNSSGLMDASGGHPDWVEIRNCSAQPVPLRGMTLGREFLGNSGRYVFPDTDTLKPFEHRVILCDGHPSDGPGHAPFTLDRQGGEVVLTGTGALGARFLVDRVVFGPQETDVAYARLGCGGDWYSAPPTPGRVNVLGAWRGFIDSQRRRFVLTFPTAPDQTYQMERTDSLAPGSAWKPMATVSGDGFEAVVTEPIAAQRFYRIHGAK
jgi:hypothetical protein